MATFSPGAAFSKAKGWASAHKVWSGVILVALLAGGYAAYGAMTGGAKATTYVLGTVGTGTVVSTISGSGQVSAENQVALSPKASGTIIAINVKAGDTVSAGQAIASIDPGTTLFELESAKLAYQDALSSAQDESESQDTALTDAKNDARAKLLSAESAFSSVLTSLDALLAQNAYLTGQRYNTGSTGSGYYRTAADDIARAHAAEKAYRAQESGLSGQASESELASALDSAYAAAQTVALAAGATQDAVVYFRDQDAGNAQSAASAYTSASSAVSSANGAVSDVSSVRTALRNAAQDVSERGAAPNQSSVRSAELSLEEKQQAYEDTFVTAPFSGVVAKVSAKQGDSASSGTAIATVITKEQLAEITLNEVDVAKVKQGQKATITFDAIDGLSISGTVAEVDGIGTVSQGVVSYTVKIAFDTQDDRVKPGMTANADIETGVAADVLVVPASAVKVAGGASYVLVPAAGEGAAASSSTSGVVLATPPQQVPVETGLSDDTNVEITSGLSEGQTIVVKSVTATAAKSTAAAATSRTTGTGAAAGRAGFGGGAAVRVP